jgi:H-type small acid-soluble spore protein
MNNQRASEILRGKGNVRVSYNGMPVWLETMDGDNMEVSFIGMNQSSIVPISGLVEADPLHSL